MNSPAKFITEVKAAAKYEVMTILTGKAEHA